MANENGNRQTPTPEPKVGVQRRGLLKFGTFVTTFTGMSVLSTLGTSNAIAAPGDKNQPTAYVPIAEKGIASGVATLGVDAKIPSTQLPDFSATYETGSDEVIYVSPAGNDAKHGKTINSPKATISAALAAFPNGRGTVVAMPGRHAVIAGLTVDVAKQRILGSPGSILDFTGLTSGAAITAVSIADPPYWQSRAWLDTVQVLGPGKSTSVVGLRYTGTSAGPSHAEATNLTVSAFGTGIEFCSKAYVNNIQSSDIFDCSTAISAPNGMADAGERISLTNCNIFNSTTGISAKNSTGEIHLHNCSIDYNLRQIDVDNSQVVIYGGHIENSAPGPSTPDFKVAGNAGVIRMYGGIILHNGAQGLGNAPCVVENSAGNAGGAFFHGVHLMNLMSSTGTFSLGPGLTVVEESTAAANSNVCKSVGAASNLLADGGFEGTTLVDDWYITKDSASITNANRHVGSDIKLTTSATTFRSGIRSLRIEKVFGNGTEGACRLAVPITRGCKPLVRLYWSKPGAEMGSISIEVRFANLQTNPTNGIPMSTRSQLLGSSYPTLKSAAIGWTKFELGEPTLRAPLWATHVVLEFNLFSFIGPGFIYVDDIEVTQI